jgi:putative membrane protein
MNRAEAVSTFRSNRFLHILMSLFLAVWIISAVKPEIPEDWMLENLLVFLLVGVLIATWRWLALSNFSYLLIFVFLCLHECGAHYQYSAAVPGEWLKTILHTDRNHYDRFVHLSFGLLLWYPQREILMRKAGLRGVWLDTLPVFTTLAWSALYEMIEAVTASVVDPVDALAFLGSQGDPWDSQEDMFMALCGAVISLLLSTVMRRFKSESIPA